MISLRLSSLHRYGHGSSDNVVVVVVIVVGCRLCYGTSKIDAHISGWRVSIIVDLGPPNLGKEELGSNDLDQVAPTEEGSGWPFFHVGLKTASKGWALPIKDLIHFDHFFLHGNSLAFYL